MCILIYLFIFLVFVVFLEQDDLCQRVSGEKAQSLRKTGKMEREAGRAALLL